MKNLIVLILLLAVATSAFSQQSLPKQHWTDTDYYKKSKKQKTAGWIFTGVGTAVLLTTVVADAFTSAFSGFQEKASGIAVPYAVGLGSVATGIGFFIASSNNKKKAKASTVFIGLEKHRYYLKLQLAINHFL